jgi:cellulose synthase/poly-beta-1,6-N-acetylglucosamine synthase-like glycosyltransferase
MSTLLPAVASLLGALDALVGLYSLYASYRYRGYVRRLSESEEPSLVPGAEWPKALLVAPCCGVEPDLEGNLEALLTQDYPHFHVRFVVEDERDEALPTIQRLLERHPGRGDVVAAGPAKGCSQKIQNLIAAIRTAPAWSVVLFADSDGRPRPSWMKELVLPLTRPEVGAASSYRFYVPDPANFSTFLRSVWNLSVLTLLGDHDRNFAWGGATAMRREVFERVEVLEAWKNALSDDYALTHAVRRAGLRVEFVPKALVGSRGPVGLLELFSWIGRQVSITRVYWPGLFRLAATTQVLHTSFLLLVPFAPSAPLLGLAATVVGLGSWSSAVRVTALGTLAPAWRNELKKWRLVYVLLSPLSSFLTVQGVFRALFSRRVEWRGKVYEMRSPAETIILAERV